MQSFPNAAFLDIGSNIGSFSVAVAGMHPIRQVIAVDADAVNLAYIRKSLEKNLLWETGSVRLIHNAVSDKRGILYPFNKEPANVPNPGGTRMVHKDELMRMKISEEQLDKKKILHQE